MLWPRLGKRLFGRPVTDAAPAPPDAVVQALAERLEATARARLGRSLAIREVDAGSCNGCELEVNAMAGVLYDMERFGLRIVASPRHADVLLVTGPVTRNMREALERTRACTPEPCWIVAAGDCAVDGGVFKGSYGVDSGVASVLPVDLVIPGCPPTPLALLEGLLSLLEAQDAPKPRATPAA
ncbi:NADH-quinone oxidoreductase subunit B family protein [Roseomonas sp. AR75]|uniref:NADH-quinone oxidoreductase subunit B family protein n=1 Tax=Roseomonas sp. AR75 TaxID=2562311 RepID=UPI0010BF68D3|nr:NADH-quinone oxidoreductase subunit NuoB [Roseomonas sp. AR75]